MSPRGHRPSTSVPYTAAAASQAGPHGHGWAAAGLLAGVLLSLWQHAPAAWLARSAAALTHDRLLLTQTQGTVWQGSAQAVLSAGAGASDAQALAGRLHWQIRPSWGDQGWGVSVQLSADCCTSQPMQLHWQPQWAGWRLQWNTLASRWPAAVLSGLGAPWNTLQPSGEVALQSRSASLTVAHGRAVLQGTVQVQALNVSASLSTLRPLGSYQLDVQGGDTTTLALRTLEGRLNLSGQGQWLPGALRFTGQASALPENLSALNNLLNLVGARQGASSTFKIG